MTGFCKARLEVDPRLQAVHGILRGAGVGRTADAHVLAGQIVEQGRQQAQQLLLEAQEEARLAVREAQARVLEQAMLLQQGMDAAMAELWNRRRTWSPNWPVPCTTGWCWKPRNGRSWRQAAAACCMKHRPSW